MAPTATEGGKSLRAPRPALGVEASVRQTAPRTFCAATEHPSGCYLQQPAAKTGPNTSETRRARAAHRAGNRKWCAHFRRRGLFPPGAPGTRWAPHGGLHRVPSLSPAPTAGPSLQKLGFGPRAFDDGSLRSHPLQHGYGCRGPEQSPSPESRHRSRAKGRRGPCYLRSTKSTLAVRSCRRVQSVHLWLVEGDTLVPTCPG